MSDNYHTPYPEAMDYTTSNLNIPPGELDAQITIMVADVLLRLQVGDFVVDDADGQIVIDDADGEPVVDM